MAVAGRGNLPYRGSLFHSAAGFIPVAAAPKLAVIYIGCELREQVLQLFWFPLGHVQAGETRGISD